MNNIDQKTFDDVAAKILVVEDDPTIQLALKSVLKTQNCDVVIFDRVDQAWEWLLHNTPNVAILDINLPDDTGFNLACKIRKSFECGILILSTRSSTNDMLHALELGVDHYITKPFLPRELLLRINNLILRNRQLVSLKSTVIDEVQVGNWQVSFEKQHIENQKDQVKGLTKLEANVLLLLTSSPGKLFNRETLVHKIHNGQKRPTNRTVDLLIMGLRRKLEEPKGNPKHIITVAGGGYYFQE